MTAPIRVHRIKRLFCLSTKNRNPLRLRWLSGTRSGIRTLDLLIKSSFLCFARPYISLCYIEGKDNYSANYSRRCAVWIMAKYLLVITLWRSACYFGLWIFWGRPYSRGYIIDDISTFPPVGVAKWYSLRMAVKSLGCRFGNTFGDWLTNRPIYLTCDWKNQDTGLDVDYPLPW